MQIWTGREVASQPRDTPVEQGIESGVEGIESGGEGIESGVEGIESRVEGSLAFLGGLEHLGPVVRELSPVVVSRELSPAVVLMGVLKH
jgi:hypothetical protein